MRRRVFKYFDNREWADAFLDGGVFFQSLAYFRDYEDEEVRRDINEGTNIFRPPDGLVINNQGRTFRMPEWAFQATAKQEEIFVFCTSTLFSEELRQKFKAVACVEISQISSLCQRIREALPAHATFHAGKVEYYDEREGGTPRWALPDSIAMSKLKSYAWQFEYRFIFCLTDALKFEKASLRLVKGDTATAPNPAQHHKQILQVKNLRDICRLREFV